jgi:hypothetical protein
VDGLYAHTPHLEYRRWKKGSLHGIIEDNKHISLMHGADELSPVVNLPMVMIQESEVQRAVSIGHPWLIDEGRSLSTFQLVKSFWKYSSEVAGSRGEMSAVVSYWTMEDRLRRRMA